MYTKTRNVRSKSGQLALDTTWQDVPITDGTGNFIMHSDVDLLVSFEDTPVDAEAFKLVANVGLEWPKQVAGVTVKVKSTAVGTAWLIS